MNRFKGNKKVLASLGIGSAAFMAGQAMAQSSSIDVSGPLAVLAAVVTAAASIGAAYLGMVFGIKAYKWIRGSAS